MGNLENTGELLLQDNFLVGTIGTMPAEISRMKKLRSLLLQNNLLTGHVGASFNQSTQLELSNIDISNNRLSGSLSTEMFLLPELKVLLLPGA